MAQVIIAPVAALVTCDVRLDVPELPVDGLFALLAFVAFALAVFRVQS